MRTTILTLRACMAALLLTGGIAHAQSVSGIAVRAAPGGESADAQSGDWRSYRDVYKLMIAFEKYGKPKQFIQIHYRVVPRDKSYTLDGVDLALRSKSMDLNLALDAAGRTSFPLLKAAYDDNAELVINRKPNQYDFTAQVSITPRPDGIYETGDLRTACDQAIDYLQFVSPSTVRGKKCVGIKFSYPRGNADSPVKYRDAQHPAAALPSSESGAFQGDDALTFKTITWRFPAGTEHGQIVTQSAPIAIAAVIE